MATVASAMSMSLDGFVTGPNDSRKNPLGEGGEVLHHWLGPTATPEDQAVLQEMVADCGAILMGRRSYDFCVGDGGWGDGGPAGRTPCFVLTHQPPAEAPDVFTFVIDGIESAIAQAKAAAGDHTVGIHGATAAQQALAAGLLDQIHIHLVPVLLGNGVRLFDLLGGTPVTLTRKRVIAAGSGVTHLQFHVPH
ncbi:dihydrofolate reductase [Kribbella voronezhensis]|uniref:Dihydrofolate reductase n=1 Tax=Kribbella voronezhensis TaxID=2512212 RepID=A0A4R7T7T6_9ACTN|nr:dihydrofolate reductase family protein [Kribbella voronezhensis]TDU87941.1 dihydrofolate reductase [Kribbella voronezhensis]